MYFEHCLATDMQNVDEASPSIILAGLALLMKMCITLELRGIFLLKFCILLYYYTTAGMRNGDEAAPSINFAGQTFSENAQNSWTARCILINFECFYINILTWNYMYQEFCSK